MENLDIDKFLDNDYDTIAKPDYSSLSLEERASRGDADAQNELGTAYMQGYGVQLDYKKGFTGSSRLRRKDTPARLRILVFASLPGSVFPKTIKTLSNF